MIEAHLSDGTVREYSKQEIIDALVEYQEDWVLTGDEEALKDAHLHATMLHLLGLDHKKLTYRFNGRDMRLTDVYGTLIPQIAST